MKSTCMYYLEYWIKQVKTWKPGPICSKLTMSLVNDSLKFTSSDTQMCWNFLLKKNVSNFCSAKATHIFSAKNIRILYIESAKTVNEMTLNELIKLTTLWTAGPWSSSNILCIFCKNISEGTLYPETHWINHSVVKSDRQCDQSGASIFFFFFFFMCLLNSKL